jgi:hypothetical protein
VYFAVHFQITLASLYLKATTCLIVCRCRDRD